MKILLSIKPEFANKIFDGSKRFEFRRSIFRNKEVNSVVVYASAPVSKVIGEFDIEKVHNKELNQLWNETKDFSGITREYYDLYFSGKEEGFAIQVKNPRLYNKAKNLKEEYNMVPPQSFAYIG
ncbi:ASCH domain-containing protein [Fluviicola sp.]|uniref:ASCH domain-containing protein n=1 Tax=Fluviicola sp. TaxID=1917219 RepID=UPI003D294981